MPASRMLVSRPASRPTRRSGRPHSSSLASQVSSRATSAQRFPLDGNPATDTAVRSIECSRSGISRQLSDRGQGHAVSGTDRMQCAIRVNVPASSPDDNLAADDAGRQRARIGTSGAGERPCAVEIRAIVLWQRRRRRFGGRLHLILGTGKECQFGTTGLRLSVL